MGVFLRHLAHVNLSAGGTEGQVDSERVCQGQAALICLRASDGCCRMDDILKAFLRREAPPIYPEESFCCQGHAPSMQAGSGPSKDMRYIVYNVRSELRPPVLAGKESPTRILSMDMERVHLIEGSLGL